MTNGKPVVRVVDSPPDTEHVSVNEITQTQNALFDRHVRRTMPPGWGAKLEIIYKGELKGKPSGPVGTITATIFTPEGGVADEDIIPESLIRNNDEVVNTVISEEIIARLYRGTRYPDLVYVACNDATSLLRRVNRSLQSNFRSDLRDEDLEREINAFVMEAG